MNFKQILLCSTSVSKAVRKTLCVCEIRAYLIRMHSTVRDSSLSSFSSSESLKKQLGRKSRVLNAVCAWCWDCRAAEIHAPSTLPRKALLPSAQAAGMENSWPGRDCNHSALLLWFYVLLFQKLQMINKGGTCT